MKKTTAIIAVAAAVAFFAIGGCQKQEQTPAPAVQSEQTPTTSSAPTMTAPAAEKH